VLDFLPRRRIIRRRRSRRPQLAEGFPGEVGIISGRILREKDLEGPAGAHLVSAVVIALDIIEGLPRNQRNAVTAERAETKGTLPLVGRPQHGSGGGPKGKTNTPPRRREGPGGGRAGGPVAAAPPPPPARLSRLRRIRDQGLRPRHIDKPEARFPRAEDGRRAAHCLVLLFRGQKWVIATGIDNDQAQFLRSV